MASSTSAPPPQQPASCWAALPRDVLLSIFTALGQREILSGAGLACVPWRNLARDEPAFWRRIDLTTPDDNLVEHAHHYLITRDEDDYSFDEDSDDEETRAKELTITSDNDECMYNLFDYSPTDADEETCAEDSDVDEDKTDIESLLDPPIYQEATPDEVEEEEDFGHLQEVTSEQDDDSVEDDDGGHLSDDIEILFALFDDDSSGWKAMALAAIDRSAGQCEAFWGRADDEVLLHLASRFGLNLFLFHVYMVLQGITISTI